MAEEFQFGDKAIGAIVGAVVTTFGLVVTKLLGFLDGGRKAKMDQLNIALEEVKRQQTENIRIRAEHDTKIAVLEQKVDSLQESLLDSKGMLIEERAEKNRVINELQQTRKALDEAHKQISSLQETLTALNSELSRMRRRKDRTDRGEQS